MLDSNIHQGSSFRNNHWKVKDSLVKKNESGKTKDDKLTLCSASTLANETPSAALHSKLCL